MRRRMLQFSEQKRLSARHCHGTILTQNRQGQKVIPIVFRVRSFGHQFVTSKNTPLGDIQRKQREDVIGDHEK